MDEQVIRPGPRAVVRDDVVQRHTAEVTHRIAPPVEQDRHHRDVVLGEDPQPGLEVGAEALRVALMSLVRQPPASDVPLREVSLPRATSTAIIP
jgi:hypothetical protein